MCRKLICLISLVLLVGMACNVSAVDVNWDDTGADHLWSTASNWVGDSVPDDTECAIVNYVAAGEGPTIQTGISAHVDQLIVGSSGQDTAEVTMTGGTLAVDIPLIVGHNKTNVGVFNLSGGAVTVTNEIWMGRAGDGTLNMTGGTLTASNNALHIPQYTYGTGHIQLDGGTITVKDFYIENSGGTGTMDITNGTLIVDGDETTKIQGYYDNDKLTIFGGDADAVFNIDYNVTNAGKTTVWADHSYAYKPYPASPEGFTKYAVGTSQLSWTPGDDANSHDVYFGTTFADVNDANTSDVTGIYKGRQVRDSNSYDPAGTQTAGTTYYWRIDEVNEATSTTWKGDVWQYTVYDSSVSGTISSNTTWSGGVHVTDTVTVNEGVTLTVSPGTHVCFKNYRGYQDPNGKLRLNVHGLMTADGNSSLPIYFTSDAQYPVNGDWNMIRLFDSNSTFDYCVVEFAQQGINMWDTSIPTISHSSIRWCNWEGLYCESYTEPNISYTRITQNGYNGLAAEQYNTVAMAHCEVDDNGTCGVHDDVSTLQIRNSRIHDNHAHGLSTDNVATLRAYGCAINDNGSYGIANGNGENDIDINNVTFSGNFAGEIKGDYNVVTADFEIPASIDLGFTPATSYALGYTPSDDEDTFDYVYPNDSTRQTVNRIGAGLGNSWSLAWDGTYIWTANLGGKVYKLNATTGATVDDFNAPGPQPWGMTYDGTNLWIVDFAERKFYKVNPSTGATLADYNTPDATGGCKGITWDGTYLYIMGWTSANIYKVDPSDGSLLDTIPLEVFASGGITWDGHCFWVPNGTGKIRKFNTDGNSVGWIYPISEGCWDLTWDGTYLWSGQRTNENWQDDKIFQTEILDDHDYTKPTPDPMTWASNPASGGPSSITMTATTATDDSGVEYYFECTTDSNHSSSWQTSATYIATGLDPNTTLAFKVKARDLSPNHNTTAYSSEQSATTSQTGYKVQSGRVEVTGSSKDVSITAVSDMSRAFVLISNGTGWQNAETDADEVQVRGYLQATDNVRIERTTSDNSTWVSYQVIECFDEEFEVFRGSDSLGSGDSSETLSIGATVTTANCLAYVTADNDTSSSAYYNEAMLTARVSSTTQVTIEREDSGNVAPNYNWVVVEFDTGKIDSIQHGSVTLDDDTHASPNSVTISSVDTGDSILIFQVRPSANGLNQVGWAGNIASSTTLEFYQDDAVAGYADVEYYVIDFGSDATAQRGENDESTNNGWLTSDATISAVDTSKTMMFHSQTCNGNGWYFPRPYSTAELTSSTNLRIQRMTNNQPSYIEWQVLELPNN